MKETERRGGTRSPCRPLDVHARSTFVVGYSGGRRAKSSARHEHVAGSMGRAPWGMRGAGCCVVSHRKTISWSAPTTLHPNTDRRLPYRPIVPYAVPCIHRLSQKHQTCQRDSTAGSRAHGAAAVPEEVQKPLPCSRYSGGGEERRSSKPRVVRRFKPAAGDYGLRALARGVRRLLPQVPVRRGERPPLSFSVVREKTGSSKILPRRSRGLPTLAHTGRTFKSGPNGAHDESRDPGGAGLRSYVKSFSGDSGVSRFGVSKSSPRVRSLSEPTQTRMFTRRV